MAIVRDRVLASLKVKRIPPGLCWGTPEEFIQSLVEALTVSLDVHPNNDFVVIGHQVPSEDDKGKLWIRLARNGSFSGFFLFVDGSWQRVHNYRNDEVIWMFGDSRNIPDGFRLVDASHPMPTDIKQALTQQYVIDTSVSSTSPVYKYFAVTYTGV